MTKRIIISGQETISALYKNLDPRIKPILQKFGREEWGERGYVISLKIPAHGKDEESGWVVRQLAGESHYRIEIRGFRIEESERIENGYLVQTGGESILTKGLSEQDLSEALEEALKSGPSHLKPPWR